MNGYVLGKNNSKVYNFYTHMYVSLMLDFLAATINSVQEGRDTNNLEGFVVLPQISSLLSFLYQQKKSKKISIFLSEWNMFLSNNFSSLSDNAGEYIAGTNILLSNKDLNPYRSSDTHPDHTDDIIGSFGKKTCLEWQETFKKSFNILSQIDKDFFDELDQNIHKIVPHGTSYGVHNSGTYNNCIGQIYIGYTLDSNQPEIDILEAIIHESSHNKLNLIMHFDPVIQCSGEERYYSAIRPDARPIRGVFLGYHAFVPTMYIIMKAYLGGYIKNREEWITNITLYYIKTKFLQKVVKKHAHLTEVGKKIDSELNYVILLIDELFKDINPSKQIIMNAKESQKEHFIFVNKQCSNLLY